ncbi:hypothetical protein ACH4E7_16065 [Kitasatospora sp. NPDC018058]|uniref:hypothetical protein n=1 Tax=Kitasatospora sp. NPDC018058 TaxID=3364025 RepID=UPI0037C1A0B0
MLGDILLAVGEMLGTAIGEGRTEARKTRDGFAKGQVVVVEGCVAGARPYCRPEPGFLHVSATALAVSPVREPSALARYLPSGGLELVELRRWRQGDPETVAKHWDVFVCRDGEDVVLIGCSDYASLVRAALQFDGA